MARSAGSAARCFSWRTRPCAHACQAATSMVWPAACGRAGVRGCAGRDSALRREPCYSAAPRSRARPARPRERPGAPSRRRRVARTLRAPARPVGAACSACRTRACSRQCAMRGHAPSGPPWWCRTPSTYSSTASAHPPLASPSRCACSLAEQTRAGSGQHIAVLRARAGGLACAANGGARRRTHDVLVHLVRDAALAAVEAVVQVWRAAAHGKRAFCGARSAARRRGLGAQAHQK
jgi:hypothetical protein